VVRRDDWLLAQLPVGMVEDEFFVRFVSIFQEVATSIMEGVDNLENIVDVTVAPEPMVRWLASWIGIDSVDASLPHQVQRQIVRASAQMLAWRGTRRGLRQFLELMSGGPAEIEDGGGVYAEGAAPDQPAWVRMRVGSTGWLPEADFVALVRDEVPAHVSIELWVGGRQVLPAAAFVPTPRTAPDELLVDATPQPDTRPETDAGPEIGRVEP
jgi:phage tail-like protein